MNDNAKTSKRRYVFIGMAVFSVVFGVAASFAPWDGEDGSHGMGFPIPSVVFVKASHYYDYVSEENDYFVDFPNPLAYIFNSIACLLFLSIVWGAVEAVFLLVRPVKTHEDTPGAITSRFT
jgi:hypothetical protein